MDIWRRLRDFVGGAVNTVGKAFRQTPQQNIQDVVRRAAPVVTRNFDPPKIDVGSLLRGAQNMVQRAPKIEAPKIDINALLRGTANVAKQANPTNVTRPILGVTLGDIGRQTPQAAIRTAQGVASAADKGAKMFAPYTRAAIEGLGTDVQKNKLALDAIVQQLTTGKVDPRVLQAQARLKNKEGFVPNKVLEGDTKAFATGIFEKGVPIALEVAPMFKGATTARAGLTFKQAVPSMLKEGLTYGGVKGAHTLGFGEGDLKQRAGQAAIETAMGPVYEALGFGIGKAFQKGGKVVKGATEKFADSLPDGPPTPQKGMRGGYIAFPNATDFASRQARGKTFKHPVTGQEVFLVSDKFAKLKKNAKLDEKTGAKAVGEIFDHPNLYRQYPGMKDVTVELRPLKGGTKGGMSLAGDRVVIDSAWWKKADPEERVSMLLHELNHGIQQITPGAPRGGSSAMFDDIVDAGSGRGLRQAEQVLSSDTPNLDAMMKADPFGEVDDAAIGAQMAAAQKSGKSKGMLNFLKRTKNQDAVDAMVKQGDTQGLYEHLAGEVDSRAVAGPMRTMSQAELDNIRLQDMYDVNPDSVIPFTGLKNGEFSPLSADKVPKIKLSRGLNADFAPPGVPRETAEAIQKQTQRDIGELSHKELKKLATMFDLDTRELSNEEIKKRVARQVATQTAAWAPLNNAQGPMSADQLAEVIRLGRASSSQGTLAARSLNARKVINEEGLSPFAKVMRMASEKSNKTAEEIAAAFDGVDPNNPDAVVKAYRSIVKASPEEWLDVVRYNSMLSNPATHAVNITSNMGGTGLLTPIRKTVAGGVDFLAHPLDKSKRTHFAGEGLEYLKGYLSNLGQGARNARNAYKNADISFHNPDAAFNQTYDMPLATSKGGKGFEKLMKVPGKFLEAADQFFMTPAQAGELASLQYRVAKGGMPVDAIEKQAAEQAQEALFRAPLNREGQGFLNSTIDRVVTAVPERLRSLKSNPSDDVGKRAADTAVRMTGKATFPFLTTPTNVIKSGFDHTPIVGLANLPGNKDKASLIAKQLIGTGVISAVLGSGAEMTGRMPTSQKEKDAFIASGRQPYSIKIGDNWVQFNRLHPALSFPLFMAQRIQETQREGIDTDPKTLAEEALSMIGAAAGTGALGMDQSAVKNIGQFADLIGGDPNAASQMISNYVQQLFPMRGMGSFIAQNTDNIQRQIDPKADALTKQWQSLSMGIPGLRQTQVPARIDPATGAEVPAWNNNLNAISPIRITPAQAGGGSEQLYQEKYTPQAKAQTKADREAGGDKWKYLGPQVIDEEQRQFLQMDSNERQRYIQANPDKAEWAIQTENAERTAEQMAKGGYQADLPYGINPEAAKVLNNYGRLSEKGKKRFEADGNNWYALAVANFEKKRAKGEFTNDLEMQDEALTLQKKSIQKDYPTEVRNLYTKTSLSKKQIIEYLKTNPNGQAIWDQLIDIDKKLLAEGLIERGRFLESSGGSGGGGRGGSKSTRIAIGKAPKFGDLFSFANAMAKYTKGGKTMKVATPNAPVGRVGRPSKVKINV